MRVPLSWLREYVPVEVSARELADRLGISTCDVDRIERSGIAREEAALYELVLADPPGRDPSRDGDEQVEVEVDDFEGCPRYIGRLFRDVTIAPSPVWLKARLLAAGMRPISNIVDVTNYVM